MDKGQAVEIVRKYADVVRQNFPVRKIILYGSYARGVPREGSDIDVAIVLRRYEGDWLQSRAKLFKLRRDIEPMIEPVLLEEENDPSGFLADILKTGEIIYSAD
jgi:predicted nucleotidyltransferase